MVHVNKRREEMNTEKIEAGTKKQFKKDKNKEKYKNKKPNNENSFHTNNQVCELIIYKHVIPLNNSK